MTDQPDLSTFQRKLAEKRARDAARLAAAREAEPEHDADLIPEVQYDRTEADIELDRIIENIDILDAYRRWCGKMEPKVRSGQRESIKISCPIPGHRDLDPSCWVNLDKQTWYCEPCGMGGDAHDIAAFHFGYPVPGYKEGAAFRELREQMAKDYGYTIERFPGDVTVISPPERESAKSESGSGPESQSPSNLDTPDKSDTPSEAGESDTFEASVVEEHNSDVPVAPIELYDDADVVDDDTPLPSLDWTKIVPEDTYLHTYMQQVIADDVPEEYHFWNALLGLGFALGREVRLRDFVPVYGNLFICALGRSGSGKSKAKYYLDTLLAKALPYKHDDETNKGVRRVSSPGSAEVLIHNFQKPIYDPADPKKVAYYASVKGIVDFNELSALVGRSSRAGNVIKPALMQFYDMEKVVMTSSLTHGSKEAHGPFASALTTTQPKALRDLITNSDDVSGFLNRWIFVGGKYKKKFAIGGAEVDMTPAVKPLIDIVGWAASFGSGEFIEWSQEAAAKFTEFFHRRIEPDKMRSQSDLIVRIDLALKKLILLFTANRMLKQVPIVAVEEAIYCYDYLIRCYGIPEAQMGNTLENEITEAILYQIKRLSTKDGKGITLNSIALSLKKRKYPKELLLRNIDALVKLGFLKVETSKAGERGRPTVRYSYVG